MRQPPDLIFSTPDQEETTILRDMFRWISLRATEALFFLRGQVGWWVVNDRGRSSLVRA